MTKHYSATRNSDGRVIYWMEYAGKTVAYMVSYERMMTDRGVIRRETQDYLELVPEWNEYEYSEKVEQ